MAHRHHIRFLFFFLALSLLCKARTATAQEYLPVEPVLRIGPVLEGSAGVHRGAMEHLGPTFPYPFSDDDRPVFVDETGTGIGYGGGLALEFSPQERFTLRADLLYRIFRASWSEKLPSGKVLLSDPEQSIEQYHEAVAEIEGEEAEIVLTGFVRLSEKGNIRLGFGPSLSFPLTLSESRRLQPGPNGVTRFDFPGFPYPYNDTLYSENRPVEGMNDVRFGLQGGLFGDIGICRGITLSPGLYGGGDLTPVAKDSDWRTFRIGLRLGLTADL